MKRMVQAMFTAVSLALLGVAGCASTEAPTPNYKVLESSLGEGEALPDGALRRSGRYLIAVGDRPPHEVRVSITHRQARDGDDDTSLTITDVTEGSSADCTY